MCELTLSYQISSQTESRIDTIGWISAISLSMIIYFDPSLTDSTYEYALDDETACESVPLISADGRRTLIVNHFSRKPPRTGGPERWKNVDWRHKSVINPFICTFNINFYLLKIELNNFYFPLCTNPLTVLKSGQILNNYEREKDKATSNQWNSLI